MATVAQIQTAIKNATAANDTAAVGRLQALLDKELKAGATPGDMSWGDVAYNAAKNAIPSAGKLVGDYAQALLHPIDTAKAVGDVGAGALRAGAAAVLPESVISTLDNLGGAGENSQRAADAATAVGRFYGDRYGSMEGFKRSIAEDPVGVAADVSVPLTLGGSAAARAPGVAGRVGQIAARAGRALDPVTAAIDTAGGAGRLARGTVGAWAGTGDAALTEAFRATRTGGKQSAAYYDSLRGNAPLDSVVDEARTAFDRIDAEGAKAYQDKYRGLKASTAKVNLKNVADQLLKTIDDMQVSGNWTGGPSSQKTAERIMSDLISWAKTPAATTLTGLDGLKKRVNSYHVTAGPGVSTDRLQANRIVEVVRDALNQEITRVHPEYASMTKGYATNRANLRELERTLSLGDTASTDTALRKLLSGMRNNVQANFGQREKLLRDLEAAGADTLMPSLAGQTLSSWSQRGIARQTAPITDLGSVAATVATANPIYLTMGLANRAVTSPRLIGEITGKMGEGAGLLDKATGKAPQAIRDSVRASGTPARRAITQETGGIANEEETMLIDAKGNVYDKKGRLIRRAGE